MSKIIPTLLDDSFPGDVGHGEHRIKYVAAEERDRLVSLQLLLCLGVGSKASSQSVSRERGAEKTNNKTMAAFTAFRRSKSPRIKVSLRRCVGTGERETRHFASNASALSVVCHPGVCVQCINVIGRRQTAST